MELLVDVRRFPGSRRDPSVARESLADALPAAGSAYHWEPALGGRRSLPAGAVVVDTWWTVQAFAAYAAYTRTPEFDAALTTLTKQARERRTAVMCSEAVWWRCHRRLIADVLVVGHGLAVEHLMHGGSLRPHQPAAGARRAADGTVVWDAG